MSSSRTFRARTEALSEADVEKVSGVTMDREGLGFGIHAGLIRDRVSLCPFHMANPICEHFLLFTQTR